MLDRRSNLACCTIKTAGVIVAFFEFLLCILALYGLARNYHLFGSPYFLWFIIGIISVVIILIVITLLLIAIKTDSAQLLLPHLFAQIFLILFCIIVALVVFLLILFNAFSGIKRLLGNEDYKTNDESIKMIAYAIVLLYLLVAAVEIVFLVIVWRLYQYLKEYELLTPRYGYSAESDMYNTQWQTPLKGMPYGRGSPEAGDVYPYGP